MAGFKFLKREDIESFNFDWRFEINSINKHNILNKQTFLLTNSMLNTTNIYH